MLGITKDDIKALSDGDLRSLIALLAESEIRSLGLSPSGVMWGGSQTSADGGVDLRVETMLGDKTCGFIPKALSIFQVKKPDMQPADIQKEMCPSGIVRPIFREIEETEGAYIIASAASDVTDSALGKRKEKMRSILAEKGFSNIFVDFYDCQRICTWVNTYPSMVIWVNERLGKETIGWRAYENWSNLRGGIMDQYLYDESLTIIDQNQSWTVLDGINNMRRELSKPRSSVRLVGLSGTGKTRLVQALFDERVGTGTLSPHLVVYADIGNSPTPSPQAMAERLWAQNAKVVLVIDNCPPTLHRALTKICCRQNSNLSLLTVEYDIKEDQPEETVVYRLEPTSNRLIEQLLYQRFDHIDSIGRGNIAKAAEGNWRIAIGIGEAIRRGENIHALSDSDLFERLFWQQGAKDDKLLQAAEVCSLVYSFCVEDSEQDVNEVRLLAQTVEMNYSELHRHVQTLIMRGLIQKRGPWRAVLPHVLANRLAKSALQHLPHDQINEHIENGGNKRIQLSFAKRLGYLHDCDEAVAIAKSYIAPGGFLNNLVERDGWKQQAVINIAPAIPSDILGIIKQAVAEHPAEFLKRFWGPYDADTSYLRAIGSIDIEKYIGLLMKIAYDAELFDDALDVLIQCNVLTEGRINAKIDSFFQLLRSSTHATWEQKNKIIDGLISSPNIKRRNLGFKLLSCTLNTYMSSQIYGDFGSHYRDYGYRPKDEAENYNWYHKSLTYLFELMHKQPAYKNDILGILSSNLCNLWCFADGILRNDLLHFAREITKFAIWPSGFSQANNILDIRRRQEKEKPLEENEQKVLDELIAILSPKSHVEAFLFLLQIQAYELLYHCDLYPSDESELNDLAKRIASHVAQSLESINQVVCDCCNYRIGNEKQELAFLLGETLAKDCPDHEEVWNAFYAQLSQAPAEERYYAVACGFLSHLNENSQDHFSKIINVLFADSNLDGDVFRILSGIPNVSYEVMMRALSQATSINMMDMYVEPQTLLNWPDEQARKFFVLFLEKSCGGVTAIKLFKRVYLWFRGMGKSLSLEEQRLAHMLMMFYDFKDGTMDFSLSELLKKCVELYADSSYTKQLLSHVYCMISSAENYVHWSLGEFLHTLCEINPHLFLDVFLESESEISRQISDVLKGINRNPGVLRRIGDALIISWCSSKQERLLTMCQFIVPFQYKDKEYSWTELALSLLNSSSDPAKIIEAYYESIRPTYSDGTPFGEIIRQRLVLFDYLSNDKNPEIARSAKRMNEKLMDKMRAHNQRDIEREIANKKAQERFE